jgi:hypothetical protein
MMTMQRVFGVALFVAGVVLIIVGIVASRSLADSLSTTFSGHLTNNTMWYIFGGIASAVVGAVLTLGVFSRRKA